jgi:hypothetical protein
MIGETWQGCCHCHLCQFTHPKWPSSRDVDPQTHHTTRRELFEHFTDTPTLIIGTHFSSFTAGRL